jgi:hypothetical protein
LKCSCRIRCISIMKYSPLLPQQCRSKITLLSSSPSPSCSLGPYSRSLILSLLFEQVIQKPNQGFLIGFTNEVMSESKVAQRIDKFSGFGIVYCCHRLYFDGMFIVKLAKPNPKTIEGATKGVKRKLTVLFTAIVKNERERIPYYIIYYFGLAQSNQSPRLYGSL